MANTETKKVEPAHNSLVERVAALDAFFDLRRIMHRPTANLEIVKYYKQSAAGYALAHSKQGSIHMALNPDGQFDPEGYYRAPDLVWRELEKDLVSSRILELGSGNGFNLDFIARTSPRLEFYGIDLTPLHVRNSRVRLREHTNVTVSVGDFQDIDHADGYFGGAYSIESFCHASEPFRAFRSVHRVLAPGARFVVVDAWRTPLADVNEQALLDALTLTERSMAVSSTMSQEEWLSEARRAGFEVVSRLELSAEVMPNLVRFESLAKRFMRHPILARVTSKYLRLRVLENVVAGYLMAESVRQGLHTYDMLTLRKIE